MWAGVRCVCVRVCDLTQPESSLELLIPGCVHLHEFISHDESSRLQCDFIKQLQVWVLTFEKRLRVIQEQGHP